MMHAAIGCLLLVPSLAAGTSAVDAKGTVLLVARTKLGRTDPEVGERDWEAFAGTGNVACRGRAPWDDNRSYYEIHSASSVDVCKELCLSKQPKCKGIEYSRGRCEIWTRKEGIASWVEPNLTQNFTCQRYGWPARHLQPMHGGVDKGCRGDHPNDKSRSYFKNYTVWNLEDCRALCVAAETCRGLQFNMFRDGRKGRCEIWNRPIRATKNKTNQTCLRFEPLPVTAPPMPSGTSSAAAPLTSTTPTTTSTATSLIGLGAGDCRTAAGLQPGYFEANHDNPRGACSGDAEDDPDCANSRSPLLFVSQEWCTRKCLEFSWCQGLAWYAYGSGSTCWFYFQVGERPEKPPDMIVADPSPFADRSYTFSWVDASNAGCGTSCTQVISEVDAIATKPWGGSFHCYVKRAPAVPDMSPDQLAGMFKSEASTTDDPSDSPLAPQEQQGDGNACPDDEEMLANVCYKKCALLTGGSHPIRKSPFSCCAQEPCSPSNSWTHMGICCGYDVAGDSVAKTAGKCPHVCGARGACLKDEDEFAGQCYKSCSILTNGAYPYRSGAASCCKTTGLACFLGTSSKTDASFAVGGGEGDGNSGTPDAPHAPMTALTR